MNESFQVGWAEVEITPENLPVRIAGQFHARVSEGGADPLVAVVLALQSGAEHAIFVSADLLFFPEHLASAVRKQLAGQSFDPVKVIFHATHTHTGPELYLPTMAMGSPAPGGDGVELGYRPVQEGLDFIAGRIAEAVIAAWDNRQPGAVAFGIEDAVVARNRRWVDAEGRSNMYGLSGERVDQFRHVEGYEDHSLNLLTTYDMAGTLTGLILNVPIPAQQAGQGFELSADFWREARAEIRLRFGTALHLLPQCSAAGELAVNPILEVAARERMLKLRGISAKQEVANRIADAIGRLLPVLETTREVAPIFHHQIETVSFPIATISTTEREATTSAMEEARCLYEAELDRLRDPAARLEPRWYIKVTYAYCLMNWHQSVLNRATSGTHTDELHFVRLGDMAFATNPFECYLDYGLEIKVRSPALQTFLVQLAGGGTYLPSPRAAAGGGYGAVPASCLVWLEGARLLVETSVNALRRLFKD